MSIFSKPIHALLHSYVKEIEGLDNIPQSGGFIIAVNHNNHLDSFILASIIKSKFNRTIKVLSRKNIMLWRIIGQWGANRLSAILVDHTKKGESLQVALDALKNGDIIGIYPEAQLNDAQHLLKARSGTARLALWTGYPIIPAGISEGPGAHRGFKLLKDILFSFKDSTKIAFGKPIQFDQYKEEFIPKEKLNEVTNEIMNAIAPLCNKTYTNH